MDQFQDFEKYMNGVNPYGMKSGIVLIDPPAEWYVVSPQYPPFSEVYMLTYSAHTGKPRAGRWIT